MRTLYAALAVLSIVLASFAAQRASADDPWPALRSEVFGDREVSPATGSNLAMYVPAQAADAAVVPLAVHLPTASAVKAKALYILVDRNPAPVAATVTFGEAWRDGAEIGDRILSTRIRVDSFSKVRAVLETVDGKLMMVAKFVAGAGGCSALPSKDMDEAVASLGRMKVTAKGAADRGPNWREGLIMIRHPNFTGMQMDAKTGSFTPARFVDRVEVKRGEQLLFRMDGGISISEDPNLRFTYPIAGGGDLSVTASDTAGRQFSGRSVAEGS